MRILDLFCLFIFMLLFSFSALGQEQNSLSRELGLRFSGFDDFNLMYKKENEKGKYLRHRVLIGLLSYNSNRSDYDFNFGYAFGVEKRKAITDKLSFISGPDFLISFAYSNSNGGVGNRNSQIILVPELGYILGFQLDLSASVYLSAEIIPSIGANVALYDFSDNLYKLTAGVNTTSTSLSLMYQF